MSEVERKNYEEISRREPFGHDYVLYTNHLYTYHRQSYHNIPPASCTSPSPSSGILRSPLSTSCRKPFMPYACEPAYAFSWRHRPPLIPGSPTTLSLSLLRLRSVHAAKARLSKSNIPSGTPTPTPTFVASECECVAGCAVTVVTEVVLVPLVSLTVVAANVAGAYGFPKTLPNVALQQLIFATSEQQKAPLKLPESPQGTAAIVLKAATRISES